MNEKNTLLILVTRNCDVLFQYWFKIVISYQYSGIGPDSTRVVHRRIFKAACKDANIGSLQIITDAERGRTNRLSAYGFLRFRRARPDYLTTTFAGTPKQPQATGPFIISYSTFASGICFHLLNQNRHILRIRCFNGYFLARQVGESEGPGMQRHPLHQRLLFSLLFKVEFPLHL